MFNETTARIVLTVLLISNLAFIAIFILFAVNKPTERDELPTSSTVSDTTSGPEVPLTKFVTYYQLDLPEDFPYSSEDFQDLVRSIADEYQIPEDLLYGIMYTESRFTPTAVSKTNDVGICQINLRYWHDFAGETRAYFDIETNVRACCNALIKWRNALTDTVENFTELSSEEQERMILNVYSGGWKAKNNNAYANLVYKNKPANTYLAEREIING